MTRKNVPQLSLVNSAITGCGGIMCLVAEWLVLATTGVYGAVLSKVKISAACELTYKSTPAVAFLGLHLLVDEPE